MLYHDGHLYLFSVCGVDFPGTSHATRQTAPTQVHSISPAPILDSDLSSVLYDVETRESSRRSDDSRTNQSLSSRKRQSNAEHWPVHRRVTAGNWGQRTVG
jgi:hypothetical protein